MSANLTFSLFFVQEIGINCRMIRDRIKGQGITSENYAQSPEYQDLLIMPTLRICEIVAKFEKELSALQPDYDWAAAAKMKHQIAHPYGGFDAGFVWDAAQSDIPELSRICDELLKSR